MENISFNSFDSEKKIYTSLSFSIRIDATLPFPDLQNKVEEILGCKFVNKKFYGEYLLVGDLLGMRVLLSEWRGLERKKTYQLHGIADDPKLFPDETNTTVNSIDISPAIITLLYVYGAGNWRIPSKEEIIAEAENASNDNWDQ